MIPHCLCRNLSASACACSYADRSEGQAGGRQERAAWHLVDVSRVSRGGERKRTHRQTALSEMSSATKREAGA